MSGVADNKHGQLFDRLNEAECTCGVPPYDLACGYCSLLSQIRAALEAAEADARQLRAALEKACDVAVWMSGSADFGPEGVAFEGWVGGMRDRLFEALDTLVGRA